MSIIIEYNMLLEEHTDIKMPLSLIVSKGLV